MTKLALVWIVMTSGCALLTPPLTAFPAEQAAPGLAELEPQIARLFAETTPSTTVLKVALAAPDWYLERDPVTGAILRRRIEAHIGYQRTDDASRCFVDSSLSFAEESVGPNAWGQLAVGGVLPGDDKVRKIGCELLR